MWCDVMWCDVYLHACSYTIMCKRNDSITSWWHMSQPSSGHQGLLLTCRPELAGCRVMCGARKSWSSSMAWDWITRFSFRLTQFTWSHQSKQDWISLGEVSRSELLNTNLAPLPTSSPRKATLQSAWTSLPSHLLGWRLRNTFHFMCGSHIQNQRMCGSHIQNQRSF